MLSKYKINTQLCILHTAGEIFSLYKSKLSAIYEAGEAEQITVMAFEHVLNYRRIDIFQRKETKIDVVKFIEFEKILAELIGGLPIQYILGHAWFHGLDLMVNSSVLIPRRETEELVNWIIADNKVKILPPVNIIDFCTGSGCIALALKKEFPLSRITAIDVSNEALDTAKVNASHLDLNIDFIQADILQMNKDFPTGLVVSNPPYVTISEKSLMHSRVINFEPSIALFVPDNDPLVFYRNIAQWSYKHLLPGSNIYFEINEKMGEAISELHSQIGFTELTLRKDMQGKNRMFRASKS